MIKRILQALFCLCLAVPAFAQSTLITVNGSLLGDSRGTSGGLLNNATITFTPVLNDGTPTSYRRGSSGGQSILNSISTNVTNGAFSLVVADTAFTSPANVCYAVTVTDNVTGNNLLGGGYNCVQPTSTDTTWCSLSAGVYSCNFDNYTPNLAPMIAVQSGPPGPPLTFDGLWSSSITYPAGAVVSYLSNIYAALQASTNNIPSSSPTFWTPVLSPASVISAPGGTQTIVQPAGTTLQVTSLNGMLNATLQAGSDIGAKVNAAVAALPSNCGKIMIPPGTYALSTTIHLHRCDVLVGSSGLATVLNWQSTTGTAIIVSDNDGSSIYPNGYISDVALVGASNTSGSSIGLYFGGDPSCTGACSTNPSTWFGDDFAVYNTKITAFKTGVSWGNHGFLNHFYATMIVANGTGIVYSGSIADSGENIAFFGSTIANSVGYAISLGQYGDLFFYGSSCDYNASCLTMSGAAQAHFIGTHFEQTGGAFVAVTTAPSDTRLMLTIEGSSFVASGTTGTDTAMIAVTDPASLTLAVNHSLVFLSHVYTNFLKWDPSTFQPTTSSSIDLTGNTGLYDNANVTNVLSTPCSNGTSFFQTCVTRRAVFSANISLTAVAANSCSNQDIGFPGYRTGDLVTTIVKATPQAGLFFQAAPVGTPDHIPVNVCNVTSAAITPTPGDRYTAVVQR